jgi:hypothetical protein
VTAADLGLDRISSHPLARRRSVTTDAVPHVPDQWRWFPQARFGLFIHWGPYAALGRGEQVANREHLDHREYARLACQWCPGQYDAGPGPTWPCARA